MFKENSKQRFQRARVFQGRLNELLFAQWLEREGWSIEGLEAHGADVDVDARSSKEISCSFEVKHLGQDEVSFNLGVQFFKRMECHLGASRSTLPSITCSIGSSKLASTRRRALPKSGHNDPV